MKKYILEHLHKCNGQTLVEHENYPKYCTLKRFVIETLSMESFSFRYLGYKYLLLRSQMRKFNKNQIRKNKLEFFMNSIEKSISQIHLS